MEDTTTKNKKTSNAARASGKGPLVLLITIVAIAVLVWFGRDFFGASQAATVNGEVVTRAEYNTRVKQIERQYEMQFLTGADGESLQDPLIQEQIRNAAMEELVNERLFFQAARSANIIIDNAEVEAELLLLKESYPDETAYQTDLNEAGITEKELMQNIKNQLTIIAYAKASIPELEYVVTEDELKEAYALNFGESLSQSEEDQGQIPSFEEFSEVARGQFEMQKLSMAIGPLLEELRANAEIVILIDLVSTEGPVSPELIAPEVESDLDEEGQTVVPDLQNGQEEAVDASQEMENE